LKELWGDIGEMFPDVGQQGLGLVPIFLARQEIIDAGPDSTGNLPKGPKLGLTSSLFHTLHGLDAHSGSVGELFLSELYRSPCVGDSSPEIPNVCLHPADMAP
jgi:hypothetical protein